jgi:exosome complex exonuclease DIS3/RRP44
VLIPDARVCVRQCDLLDSGREGVQDMLFLQTILRQLRRKSANNYDRIKALLVSAPEGVRAAIFSNENRRETYVERSVVGGSEDEYDAKSIVSAVRWLASHWTTLDMKAVIVTDSAADAKAHIALGVDAITAKQLTEEFVGLQDLYAEAEEETDVESDYLEEDMDTENGNKHVKKRRFLFPDYFPERRVRAGLKAGRLLKGTFRPSMYNVLEAWVSVALDKSDKSKRTKVLLLGRELQNRAIDGDIVIIELLPKIEWRSPSNLAVEQDDVDVESNGEENNDREKLSEIDSRPGGKSTMRDKNPNASEALVPTAQVVAISRRSWRPYCGAISSSSYTGGDRALFVPIDRKVPKIRIRSRRIPELLGQRLIVTMDKWDRGSFHPVGHVVKEIGASGDKEAETEVLLVENGIPTRKFSDAAMACLPDETWKVTEEHVATRWDLRDWTICSVDPPGCTDIDDALHFRRLNDEEVEIGVHIADVTAFVAHDSALDKEAAERGTTVYLVDRRIEMLPSLLSGNFCSLRDGVERLAFSALIRMKNDGTVLAAEFGRSVIKSSAAMTYQQAQERIDAARLSLASNPSAAIDPVVTGLLGLADVARHLRERRMAAGALTLASPEVRFKISELTDSVTDAYMYEIRETNKMVEEFMLLANIVVAEKTLQHFPHCALLRRHPKPSNEMFESLLKAADSAGYNVDASNSRALNDSLAAIDTEAKAKGDEYMGTLLRILATRCMTQAVYFSSGEVDDPEFLHYGLAAPVYTHFTSPIRRYADVLVHRLMSACLGFNSLPMTLQDSKRMNELAEQINERHQCAQFAARASTALHTLLLFKDRTLDESARVMRVLNNGLVILVPRYGVEGIVQIEEERVPVLDDVTQTLSTNDGKTYKVLSNVKVRIRVDSAPERRDKVLYELVE